MYRRLAIGLLVALLVSSVAAAAAPTADIVYVVQPGDTLTSIADRFGVSLVAVVQANHIKDFNLILVGQQLTIPGTTGNGQGGSGAGPTPAAAGGASPCANPYLVQAGDTLGVIASRCALTVSALLAANHIPNINLIFVGQSLNIPGGGATGGGASGGATGGGTVSPPAASPTPAGAGTGGGAPGGSGTVTLANPSFEDGWTTDTRGNQTPNGWTRYSPAQGQLMPFPTKMQQGAVVPAISDSPGEYVHKLAWQLPPDERLGQPRALILDGGAVYKAFNLYHAHALQLSQTLSGPPGRFIHVTVFILGETHDQPTGASGQLELDHFVASLRLGAVEDRRLYTTMKTHFDVTGDQRAWNQFAVTAQFPDSGQLPLVITVQQNWAGKTDFFIDNAHADLTN